MKSARSSSASTLTTLHVWLRSTKVIATYTPQRRQRILLGSPESERIALELRGLRRRYRDAGLRIRKRARIVLAAKRTLACAEDLFAGRTVGNQFDANSPTMALASVQHRDAFPRAPRMATPSPSVANGFAALHKASIGGPPPDGLWSAPANQTHSPLRKTGVRAPPASSPSMSILSEPIIQSMWMRLALPPRAAISSGVSVSPSTKHFE